MRYVSIVANNATRHLSIVNKIQCSVRCLHTSIIDSELSFRPTRYRGPGFATGIRCNKSGHTVTLYQYGRHQIPVIFRSSVKHVSFFSTDSRLLALSVPSRIPKQASSDLPGSAQGDSQKISSSSAEPTDPGSEQPIRRLTYFIKPGPVSGLGYVDKIDQDIKAIWASRMRTEALLTTDPHPKVPILIRLEQQSRRQARHIFRRLLSKSWGSIIFGIMTFGMVVDFLARLHEAWDEAVELIAGIIDLEPRKAWTEFQAVRQKKHEFRRAKQVEEQTTRERIYTQLEANNAAAYDETNLLLKTVGMKLPFERLPDGTAASTAPAEDDERFEDAGPIDLGDLREIGVDTDSQSR